MCPTHNTVHMFSGGRNVVVVDDIQFDDVQSFIIGRKGLQLLYTNKLQSNLLGNFCMF